MVSILNQKILHPEKGQLEIGRWQKKELGELIFYQNRLMQRMIRDMKTYQLLYGFNHDG